MSSRYQEKLKPIPTVQPARLKDRVAVNIGEACHKLQQQYVYRETITILFVAFDENEKEVKRYDWRMLDHNFGKNFLLMAKKWFLFEAKEMVKRIDLGETVLSAYWSYKGPDKKWVLGAWTGWDARMVKGNIQFTRRGKIVAEADLVKNGIYTYDAEEQREMPIHKYLSVRP